MKNIKLIIIALVALLVFNSCSNEFDFNDEKKLVRCTCVFDNSFMYIDRTFEYDKKGRLVSAYEEQYYAENVYSKCSYTYNWNKESVDVFTVSFAKLLSDTKAHYTSQNFTITLENKRFAKFVYDKEYDEYNYTYDSEGRLKRYRGSVSDVTCEWDGDKLVSAVNIDIHDDIKYKYGNISCVKGYCPIIVWDNTQEMITLAHPERVGLRTTHCPVSKNAYTEFFDDPITYNHTYEYEFDDEGYITKIIETITETVNNEEATRYKVYTLTWE